MKQIKHTLKSNIILKISELVENDDESSNNPSNQRDKDSNFNNRFQNDEDIGGLGDMMTNMNINEKMTNNNPYGVKYNLNLGFYAKLLF